MIYDYIIVGGGSAGSVLANRLSAGRACEVLLLEAGQDTPHGRVPPEVLDSYPGTAYFDPRYHWTDCRCAPRRCPTTTRPKARRRCANTSRHAFWAGALRSMGNSPIAARRRTSRLGSPAAHAVGAGRMCCPTTRRSSATWTSTVALHGKDGRIPVRAHFPRLWTGHAKAAAEAFKTAGFEYLPDQNGEWRDGYYPIAISNAYERRVSAAIGYLDPMTRQRNNLSICTDTHVSEPPSRQALYGGDRPHRRTAPRIQRARGDLVLWGHLFACAPVARRHRPGRPSQAWGSRCVHARPASARAHGPSLDFGLGLSQAAWRMNEFTRRHIHVGLRYSSNHAGHARGRHVRRRHQQIGLACGGRAIASFTDRRLPYGLRSAVR